MQDADALPDTGADHNLSLLIEVLEENDEATVRANLEDMGITEHEDEGDGGGNSQGNCKFLSKLPIIKYHLQARKLMLEVDVNEVAQDHLQLSLLL